MSGQPIQMPSLEERARARRSSRRKGRREWDGDTVREMDAAWSRRRKARLRDLLTEPYTRDEVWARTGGICGICGCLISEDGWQVDHIVPISWPDCPGDVLLNVQPAHPECNNSKGDRSSASILHANARAYPSAMPTQTRPDQT